MHRLPKLIICALALQVPAAFAQKVELSPAARARLEKLASGSGGEQIVFFDLDGTIGHFDEHSRNWVVYDGASKALERIHRHQPIALLTGNLRENLALLFEQHPELRPWIDADIPVEDFAPAYARLIRATQIEFKRDPSLTPGDWLRLAFETWSRNPAEFTDDGSVPDTMPADFSDWRREIYLKRLAPVKSPIVLEFDGLLVDDQFGHAVVNPRYEPLIASGRAIFAGPIGGDSADRGPDFRAIVELVERCRGLLAPRKRATMSLWIPGSSLFSARSWAEPARES